MRVAMFVTMQYPIPQTTKIYPPIDITKTLAEELTKRGHDVTLFASKGSKVKAKIVSDSLESLIRNKEAKPLLKKWGERILIFYEQTMLSRLYRQADQEKFDVLHVQPASLVLHFAGLVKTPTITTLHDPMTDRRKFMFSLFRDEKNLYYVSISDSQRKPLPDLNYISTIYNGVNTKKYKFNEKPKDYFIFAGRIIPEKGAHLAIAAAKKANVKLMLAGEHFDSLYWKTKIKPSLDRNIKYAGFLPRERLMNEAFRNAKALLFPIQWEEPFGLVMIEAMAVGTPVIAFNRGSVPEIVKHGKTGFIVKNVNEMVQAIKNIDQIDRRACREHVEKNFSLEKMVDNYEKVYQKVIALHKKRLAR